MLRNPDNLIGCLDVTSLVYLHEPAVLNNLRFRFEELKVSYHQYHAMSIQIANGRELRQVLEIYIRIFEISYRN